MAPVLGRRLSVPIQEVPLKLSPNRFELRGSRRTGAVGRPQGGRRPRRRARAHRP